MNVSQTSQSVRNNRCSQQRDTAHASHAANNAANNGVALAGNLNDMVAAWSLVYHKYRETGLIPQNAFEVHCSAQAVHEDAAVVVARHDGQIDSTLTVIPDQPVGLPLDKVFADELNAL